MIKKRTVRVPIYNQFKVTFVITEDINSYYTKVTREKYNSNPKGMFFAREGVIYICIKPDVSSGIVAHECFHATAYIMDIIGVELKGEGEEPYAYLLGWFVDEFDKIS